MQMIIEQEKIQVKVLRTDDTWYGMTYKEDVKAVKESFREMLENGTYAYSKYESERWTEKVC